MSRDLLRGVEPPPQPIQVEEVPKLIKAQQDFLVELITEHRQEVDGKLETRRRKFTSKALERQFEVNDGFKDLVVKALTALKRNHRKKAKGFLKRLKRDLKEHEEDLIIADTSPNGWLAVAKLRGRSDLPDGLSKKLERVDREIWRARDYGRGQKKPRAVQVPSSGGDFRTTRQLFKQAQRLSPEELLYNAAKQVRAGVCSHCRKENHFYRECPDFWREVQKAREERARGQPAPQ